MTIRILLSVLRLELWKQRKLFFSTLFVLILGVTFPAIFLSVIRSVGAIESLSGAGAFLILLLPLVIVFLAASAGSSLRKTEDRNHEELLPVHPFLRVYGAYFVSFFYTAIICLLVFSLLSVQEVFRLASYRGGIFELPFEVLLLYGWSLHCLSFGISYVLNLPVLGAGLALILSTVDLFFRTVFLYHTRFCHSDSLEWTFPTLIVPIACAFISAAIAASRLERGLRLGIKAVFPLVLCFLVVPVWTVLIAFSKSSSFWAYFWEMVAATL
jgi:hypothetical protein